MAVRGRRHLARAVAKVPSAVQWTGQWPMCHRKSVAEQLLMAAPAPSTRPTMVARATALRRLAPVEAQLHRVLLVGALILVFRLSAVHREAVPLHSASAATAVPQQALLARPLALRLSAAELHRVHSLADGCLKYCVALAMVAQWPVCSGCTAVAKHGFFRSRSEAAYAIPSLPADHFRMDLLS